MVWLRLTLRSFCIYPLCCTWRLILPLPFNFSFSCQIHRSRPSKGYFRGNVAKCHFLSLYFGSTTRTRSVMKTYHFYKRLSKKVKKKLQLSERYKITFFLSLSLSPFFLFLFSFSFPHTLSISTFSIFYPSLFLSFSPSPRKHLSSLKVNVPLSATYAGTDLAPKGT